MTVINSSPIDDLHFDAFDAKALTPLLAAPFEGYLIQHLMSERLQTQDIRPEDTVDAQFEAQLYQTRPMLLNGAVQTPATHYSRGYAHYKDPTLAPTVKQYQLYLCAIEIECPKAPSLFVYLLAQTPISAATGFELKGVPASFKHYYSPLSPSALCAWMHQHIQDKPYDPPAIVPAAERARQPKALHLPLYSAREFHRMDPTWMNTVIHAHTHMVQSPHWLQQALSRNEQQHLEHQTPLVASGGSKPRL